MGACEYGYVCVLRSLVRAHTHTYIYTQRDRHNKPFETHLRLEPLEVEKQVLLVVNLHVLLLHIVLENVGLLPLWCVCVGVGVGVGAGEYVCVCVCVRACVFACVCAWRE